MKEDLPVLIAGIAMFIFPVCCVVFGGGYGN